VTIPSSVSKLLVWNEEKKDWAIREYFLSLRWKLKPLNLQDSTLMGLPYGARAFRDHIPNDNPSVRIGGDEASVVGKEMQGLNSRRVATQKVPRGSWGQAFLDNSC
jgi:hypothetical protein